MSEYFDTVKSYLAELEIPISSEDAAEELVVVNDNDNGINNLVIDCEEPILVIEQHIMPVPDANKEKLYLRLLQMNRALVHGAFVIDDEGKNIIFRDTLELENLDLNELDGTIQALALGLAEFGSELISFHKGE